MRKIALITLTLLLTNIVFVNAQIVRTEKIDSTTNWEKLNKLGIDFTQISFVNWSAGGNNSISALSRGQFVRNYTNGNFKWANELLLKYGVSKAEGQEVRKTDDQILLSSIAGYRKDSISNWFYGAKFTFQTQFANGYNYPNIDKEISRPFAPAYVFLGIGSEYNRKDIGFNCYLSPLTLKSTFVLDQNLANEGAFGVEKAIYNSTGDLITKGKRTKIEVGALITSSYKTTVAKNINLDTRLMLYSDYLRDFGNIDVDSQTLIEMTINKYVRANVSFHIIYDDNIKSKEEVNGVQVIRGPKTQLKQIIGVGLTYQF